MILAEQVLIDHLNGHADVSALDARAATKTPNTHVNPWVRVTLLDARTVGNVEHAHDFLVQFDCFAGDAAMNAHTGPMEALDLVTAVRGALDELKGQITGAAVVSGVVFTGQHRLPDTTSEPARDRYVLTASIVMHP
ncbi:MAG: hypothetical protein ACXVHX_26750 [Solirubrobacteraceae bacterium]